MGSSPIVSTMDIHPKQPSIKGAPEWFTGDVWIESIAQGEPPSRRAVSAVHFTPGVRTANGTGTAPPRITS